MRRKRGIRPTWFPTLAGASTATGLPEATYDQYLLDPPIDGSSLVFAIPWIPDTTPDVNGPGVEVASLRDYVEGQTCIINRIVGKVVWTFAQATPANEETFIQQVICCTAIAILPVSDDEGSQGSPDLNVTEYDPLLANNSHKPWLWRRTWVLANNAAQSASQTSLFTAPGNNQFFASRDDGPHLDTKGTSRSIGRGERLFVLHAVRSLDTDNDSTSLTSVVTDLRFLGRMRRARKVSQF